jgi:hypothetical protein
MELLRYLFDHAWNRVREYGGAPAGGIGVGLHEARHWHRRAYGGLVRMLFYPVLPVGLMSVFPKSERDRRYATP